MCVRSEGWSEEQLDFVERSVAVLGWMRSALDPGDKEPVGAAAISSAEQELMRRAVIHRGRTRIASHTPTGQPAGAAGPTGQALQRCAAVGIFAFVGAVDAREPSFWARFVQAHAAWTREVDSTRRGPAWQNGTVIAIFDAHTIMKLTQASPWRIAVARRFVIASVASWEADRNSKYAVPSQELADNLVTTVCAMLSAAVIPALQRRRDR